MLHPLESAIADPIIPRASISTCSDLWGAFRLYLEPGTGVGPAFAEILCVRVIVSGAARVGACGCAVASSLGVNPVVGLRRSQSFDGPAVVRIVAGPPAVAIGAKEVGPALPGRDGVCVVEPALVQADIIDIADSKR